MKDREPNGMALLDVWDEQRHAGCDADLRAKMDASIICPAIALGLRLMPLCEFAAVGGSRNLRIGLTPQI
jgi:hypothetical protein